jgi:hypothetical protein
MVYFDPIKDDIPGAMARAEKTILTEWFRLNETDDFARVGSRVYPTFKQAANARGLLESDEEWSDCLEDSFNV